MEIRIFGPPGTGKTTYLANQISKKITSFEYTNNDFIVLSFTNAAAHEIADRGALPKDRIGTIHSMGARSLGLNPKEHIFIKHIKDWNEYIRHNPTYAINNIYNANDDNTLKEFERSDPKPGVTGDDHLGSIELQRHRCIPTDRWTVIQQAFWEKWSDWKNSNNLIDFADMIELAYNECTIAPGNPSIMMVDEAQDLTQLQTKLIRSWGKHTNYYIMCGDDDQTIYEWAGADANSLLTPPLPIDNIIILKHSHRLPRVIHEFANRVIKRCSVRQEKEYYPTENEGEITFLRSAWNKNPKEICARAETMAESGESVMILAQSAYMLAVIIQTLRNLGVPYHNPYRDKNGTWNALRLSGSGTSTLSRFCAFLAPIFSDFEQKNHSWSWQELSMWAADISSDAFNYKGAKKHIQDRAKDSTTRNNIVTFDELIRLFKDQHHEAIGSCDPMWLKNILLTSKSRLYTYPMSIFTKHRSLKPLSEPPKIIVGTIHSVKGAEADNVILLQDISPMAHEARRFYGNDALIRLFYVGVTRAKKRLLLVDPTTKFHF